MMLFVEEGLLTPTAMRETRPYTTYNTSLISIALEKKSLAACGMERGKIKPHYDKSRSILKKANAFLVFR